MHCSRFKMLGLGAALFMAPGLPTAMALEPHEAELCDRSRVDALCPHLPHDIPRFFASFVYRFLTEGAQDPFDTFSWQTFVALNWPADEVGRPRDDRIGTAPEQPRRWQSFSPAKTATQICRSAGGPPGPLLTSQFRQATGEVLIDSGLNFVVYDTRLNRTANAHLASGVRVNFPDGYYRDRKSRVGGLPGSIVLKTAWRVLDGLPAAEVDRYFVLPGHVAVHAADSADGRDHCHTLTLGLVGMHIMRKVRSGNGSDWIWSTFEHVDNAPLAGNARDANSIVSFDPFPTGCHAPDGTRRFTFFEPDCPDCEPNRIDTADWKWAPEPPFARAFAQRGRFGTQVVRCWQLFQGTAKINQVWRDALAGSVFANYQLIGTQWRGNHGGPLAGFGEVPRYLTNSTLETYIQDAPQGTCMGCHSTAQTAAGERSDFSFLAAELN